MQGLRQLGRDDETLPPQLFTISRCSPLRGVLAPQAWPSPVVGGPGSCAQLTDRAACRIVALTTPGRAAGTSWPEWVVTTVACTRLAMKNCVFVGMALSSSATISHLGVDDGGLTVAGSDSADAVMGRWTTAAVAIALLDRPPA